ncbi:hypothetical protein Tco_0591335 [Tanacetum coccineum]
MILTPPSLDYRGQPPSVRWSRRLLVDGKYEVQTDISCSKFEGEVEARGVSPRYKVLFQVAAGQSERDTWHLACVSPRRRVSVRGQSACITCNHGIMRRLVKEKKDQIPSDLSN